MDDVRISDLHPTLVPIGQDPKKEAEMLIISELDQKIQDLVHNQQVIHSMDSIFELADLQQRVKVLITSGSSPISLDSLQQLHKVITAQMRKLGVFTKVEQTFKAHLLQKIDTLPIPQEVKQIWKEKVDTIAFRKMNKEEIREKMIEIYEIIDIYLNVIRKEESAKASSGARPEELHYLFRELSYDHDEDIDYKDVLTKYDQHLEERGKLDLEIRAQVDSCDEMINELQNDRAKEVWDKAKASFKVGADDPKYYEKMKVLKEEVLTALLKRLKNISSMPAEKLKDELYISDKVLMPIGMIQFQVDRDFEAIDDVQELVGDFVIYSTLINPMTNDAAQPTLKDIDKCLEQLPLETKEEWTGFADFFKSPPVSDALLKDFLNLLLELLKNPEKYNNLLQGVKILMFEKEAHIDERQIKYQKLFDELDFENEIAQIYIKSLAFKKPENMSYFADMFHTESIATGGFGEVGRAQVKQFAPTGIESGTVVYKKDKVGHKGATKEEFDQIKPLLDKAKAEKAHLLPVLGSHHSDTDFFMLMAELEDVSKPKKKLTPTEKSEIVQSSLLSLATIQKHGFLLTDIKLQNMLYSKVKGKCKAILSDYGGLVDYKAIIENIKEKVIDLTHPAYTNLLDQLETWEIQKYAPGQEIRELKEAIKRYAQDASRSRPSEATEKELERRIKSVMAFATAHAYYKLYTNDDAYDHEKNNSPELPLLTVGVDPKKKCKEIEKKLLESGCPAKEAKMIALMLHPHPLKRPLPEDLIKTSIVPK